MNMSPDYKQQYDAVVRDISWVAGLKAERMLGLEGSGEESMIRCSAMREYNFQMFVLSYEQFGIDVGAAWCDKPGRFFVHGYGMVDSDEEDY